MPEKPTRYGELPEGWHLARLGMVGRFSASGIDKKSVEGEAPARMVNYTDVYGNRAATVDGSRDLMKVTCSPTKLREHSLRRGDLLFTPSSETKNEIGFSAVVTEDLPETVYSYHLIRYRTDRSMAWDIGFKRYVCNHPGFLYQLQAASKGTTRQILTRDDFRSATVAIPPVGVQRAIASFLDGETAKIDALIEKKRRLLDLLEEKRTALITRAVTRGLDPDAPMKDSGVEWIGEIPEHWEAVQLRHLVACLDGRRIPVNSLERASMKGEIPYWGAGGIVDYVDRALFNEPLVLLGEDGAPFLDRGKPVAFYVNEPVWVNNHIHALRPGKQVDPQYLVHALNATEYSWYIDGSTRQKLTQGDMNEIPVALPPKEEQERIADAIASWLTPMVKIGQRIDAAISLLQEYRTALISAAVTGQLDVREPVLA